MYRKAILTLGLSLLAVAAFGWAIGHAQIPISGLPNATVPLGTNDRIIVNQPVSPTVFSTRQAPLSALNPFFPPLTSHYVLQAPDPLLPQSRTLTGTANQVIIADGGALGNLTLSLPQSIATTSTPTFGGLTLTNPLAATSGGTGQNTYTLGDILASNAANSLAKVAGSTSATIRFLSQTGNGTVSALPAWSLLPGGFTGFANPTASIGLTTVNGVATTAMRSDAAPALSQAISPTMTGTWIFTPSSTASPAVTVNAPAGKAGIAINGSALSNAMIISGSSTSGQSFGLNIAAGTTSADRALTITDQTGAVAFLSIFGDGGSVYSTATGGDQGIGTVNMRGCFVNGVACLVTTSFANPTASVGLTAVNGVATTAMRSDAAPPISQAIVPTWSGVHTFSAIPLFNAGFAGSFNQNTAVQSVLTNTSTGVAADNALGVSNNTNSALLGLTGVNNVTPHFTGGPAASHVYLGTSGNIPISVGTNGIERINITGAGTVKNFETSFSVNAERNTATYETGSFTGTVTGMTAGTSGTVTYARAGNIVILEGPGAGLTGTSNTTALTLTGLPASITPTQNTKVPCTGVSDNGLGDQAAQCFILTTNQVAFTLLNVANGSYTRVFTASGVKGLNGGWTATYPLQ